MRLLLVTPPMTQLNTPYPATAYLMGFLRQHEERLDSTLAASGTSRSSCSSRSSAATDGAACAKRSSNGRTRPSPRTTSSRTRIGYIGTIDAVIGFLQGGDPGLALHIVNREFLPEGPRFANLADGPGSADDDPLAWAFGGLGITDRAKHLASLYIDDIADAIRGHRAALRARTLRRASRSERAVVQFAARRTREHAHARRRDARRARGATHSCARTGRRGTSPRHSRAMSTARSASRAR
ncbi:MAG: hypothetical protein QM703_20450 [Gemmatales bacterium]